MMANNVPTKYLICLSIVIYVFGQLQYAYSLVVLNSSGFLIRAFINESFAAEFGHSLTVDQVEILYGITNNGWDVGAVIGCFIYAPIADQLGRRYTIFFVPSLASVISAMLFVVSYCKNVFEPLLVGRIISGIGAIVAFIGVPVYLNEVTPIRQRGIINGWHTISAQMWQLVAVGLGTATALGTPAYWVWLMCWPAIPAVIFMFVCIPETPPYIYMKETCPSKPMTSRLILKFQGNDANVPKMMDEYKRIKSLYASQIGIKEIWKNKVIRKTFIISHVLAVCSAVSQTIIDRFSATMFVAAGISLKMAPYFSLIPIALTICFGLITPITVDRFGRRPLLLAAIFVQFVGMSIYIITATAENGTGSWLSYSAIFGASLASVGFSIGLGPVKFLSISEIVPQQARATTLKYCYAAAYMGCFVEGLVYPIANQSIGALCMIPLATLPQIFTFIFIYYQLPETKYRTTMQVYDELACISEKTALVSQSTDN